MTFMLGAATRTTKDIDLLMSGMDMTVNSMKAAINRIITPPDRENVWFEIQGDGKPIREEDEYGGYRFTIVGHLSNIKVPFDVDIATGDPITPQVRKINYYTITNEEIFLYAYPLETILAEKLQTILKRAEANSRAKDFYDLYIICAMQARDVNQEVLRSAVQKTFAYRNTDIKKDQAFYILQLIEENSEANQRWDNYRKKNPYASILTFPEVLSACKKLVEIAL